MTTTLRLVAILALCGVVVVMSAAVYGGKQRSAPVDSGGSFTMEDVGATQAVLTFNGEFGSRFSWYTTAVQRRISANWHQSDIDPALSSAPRVIVTFDVLRNGAIINIQIAQSSKNYSVDNSARQAVEKSSPLMALPSASNGRVSAELSVDYRKQIAPQPKGVSSAHDGVALPDCQGRPLVQPQSVTLACADGNFAIENIRWTGWGESFAAGMGTGKINNCEPNCAAGHFQTYPMLLMASGNQTCPSGQPAYEKVTYAFVGRSAFPPNAPATTDPTQEFRCRAMPQ